MPLQSKLRDPTGPNAVVNQLGDDRPAWIASINLIAARHFLEFDPPCLARSRVSLLCLADSIDRGTAEGGKARTKGQGADVTLSSDGTLRSVAARAAAIASDLAHLIDGDANCEAGPSDRRAELHSVRRSLLDLDQAIAAMLGERCRPMSAKKVGP